MLVELTLEETQHKQEQGPCKTAVSCGPQHHPSHRGPAGRNNQLSANAERGSRAMCWQDVRHRQANLRPQWLLLLHNKPLSAAPHLNTHHTTLCEQPPSSASTHNAHAGRHSWHAAHGPQHQPSTLDADSQAVQPPADSRGNTHRRSTRTLATNTHTRAHTQTKIFKIQCY